ncbi:MAG: hypothetical protein JSW67_09395 [Candidatus Latescibacterota bacterium]|nr:MAG: hypothetical protein JSW67_09395 [Candidatus Latescibacterota bacterium]
MALENFAGYFVWVDFAASWCGPCTRQAPLISKLEDVVGEDVLFLTLLTSAAEPTSQATVGTAAAWAKRYRLNPYLVVAGHERARTIPQHILFSPLGQTLYHAIGYHTDVQIRATLAQHMNRWNRLHPEVSFSE